jgi:hypothetical protein
VGPINYQKAKAINYQKAKAINYQKAKAIDGPLPAVLLAKVVRATASNIPSIKFYGQKYTICLIWVIEVVVVCRDLNRKRP